VDEDLINMLKKIKQVTNVTESRHNSVLLSCESDIRSEIAKTIVDSNRALLGMKIEEFSLEKIYKKFSRGE
jgi:hypothetical protein